MEKKIEHIIARFDFDEEFEQEVNLRTLIGNDSARAILQTYVEQYFNEKIAGLNPQISPILLIGGKGSGVHVMARAVSNTLGNLLCHTVTAKWLNDGAINIHNFLGEGDEFSGYYIDGDKLNSNNQFQLSRIFAEKKIFFYSYESQSWEKRPFDQLVIFSTPNRDNLPPILLKKFKVQVNVTTLNTEEIELALRQRVSLLNLEISSYDLITKIAQISCDVGQAMEVLSMSLLILRAGNGNTTTLTEKVVNIALKLMDKNMKSASQKPAG